ncbi:amidohydrolase family protein [Agrococcus baldri]|uniref:Amidohydrolase n=1 Tax=Agrococcus baldri TaxID=153730 RepID=A0AA87RL70_9MICO|nr:amidohydrolase [Agrococcus baldri]GEK81108.1 hypothetical protein ABA31_24590 [Agrococcus baldri]
MSAPPRLARVARARIGGTWVADAVLQLTRTGVTPVRPGSAAAATGAERQLPRHELTLLPPITDAHVHLGLSDAAEPTPTAFARVLDLGWTPAALPGLIEAVAAAHPALEIRFAGPFHAAPGGYPSDRPWAAPGTVAELADAAGAARSIRAQAAAGASVIKVMLNSDDGPVPDDALLAAIVAETHGAGLPLAAHVQGAGQAERALTAGVDILAHTPWTERLSDELVRAAAGRQTWISTLAMHGRDGDETAFARATDNLARFAAAGGAVLYGSDLGNGITRLDLDAHELAALRQAGVEGTALVDALLAPPRGAPHPVALRPGGPTISALPAEVDGDDAVIAALHHARPMRITDLEASA